MTTLTVTSSFTCTEEWEKSELHCPFCTQQAVWHLVPKEESLFYDHREHLCLKCEAGFGLYLHKGDDLHKRRDVQRLPQLRWLK